MQKAQKCRFPIIALAWVVLGMVELTSGQTLAANDQNTTELKKLTITSISDADSLRAGALRLRLHGIDAPELKQPCFNKANQLYDCGKMARDFLRSVIETGAQIECQHLDTDRYHRLIVRCFHHGQDIAAQLVRAGWALAYRRYAKDYIVAEKQAAEAGQGIWQGNFTRPEIWRRQQRQK